MKKDLLKDYLKSNHMGHEKAISGERLCNYMRARPSDLHKYVNRLRREGIPIGSDRVGYFYARTAGEVYSTIRGLKKMRAGLDAAIEGMEGALNSFSGGDGQ